MKSETKNSDGYTFAELYAKELKSAPLEAKGNTSLTVYHPRSDAPKSFIKDKRVKGMMK